MSRRSFAACAVLSALLAPGSPAAGQDQGWAFQVSPYFWAAGLRGDVGVGPDIPVAHVDMDFADVWDDLKFGFAAAGVAQRGRFGLLGDFSYVNTGSQSAARGPLFVSAEVDTKSVLAGAAAAYRVAEGDGGFLDVFLGARGIWASSEVDITFPDESVQVLEEDKSWVDPVVGVRGEVDLGPRWSLTGYADAGGGASDFTYQAYAAVGLDIGDAWRLSGGYRTYDVEYENDGFIFDVVQQGLLLGVSYDF